MDVMESLDILWELNTPMEAAYTSSSLSEAFSWKASSVGFLPRSPLLTLCSSHTVTPPASRPVGTQPGLRSSACRDGSHGRSWLWHAPRSRQQLGSVWRIYRQIRLQCFAASSLYFMHESRHGVVS